MFCWEGHREAFRLLALCDQNPEPTRQIRMLFIWGGERIQRKQVNIRLFITATSGSGSIPGREIQTTLQKFSFWAWTEAVWLDTNDHSPPCRDPGTICLVIHELSTVLSKMGCCTRQSTGVLEENIFLYC